MTALALTAPASVWGWSYSSTPNLNEGITASGSNDLTQVPCGSQFTVSLTCGTEGGQVWSYIAGVQLIPNDGNTNNQGNNNWVTVFSGDSGSPGWSGSYSLTAASAPGTYTVAVQCWDGRPVYSNILTFQYTAVAANHPPTIAWASLPGGAIYQNNTFTGTATGSDVDGNLDNVVVNVSINGGAWTALAYDNGGNGYTKTSDANLLSAGAPGTTYQFEAIASDAAGANSGYIYSPVYTVAVYQPPVTTISTSTTDTYLNQPITITATTTDQEGQLIQQAIDYLAPGSGSWVSGWSVTGAHWSGGPVGTNTLACTFPGSLTASTPGAWQFRANGSDNVTSSNYPVLTVNVASLPTATISSSSSSIYLGQSVTLNSTYAVDTAGGDSIGQTAINVAPPSGGESTLSPPGYGTGNLTATYTPTATGAYVFKADIWTSLGGSGNWMTQASTTVTVVAVPPPPVNVSMSAANIAYGQTATATARATDAAGILTTFNFMLSGPGIVADGSGKGNNPSGQPWNLFASVAATNGSDSTVSTPVVRASGDGSSTFPLQLGTYSLTLDSQDSVPQSTYNPATVMATFTVTQATPVLETGLSTQTVTANAPSNTYPLQAAVFVNPDNANAVQPTGAATYVITAATGPYASPTGAVTVGTALRAGTYTITATYPGDANYTTATATLTLTVQLDPNGASATSGLTNGQAQDLGINPYQAAGDGTGTINLQVNTPQ